MGNILTFLRRVWTHHMHRRLSYSEPTMEPLAEHILRTLDKLEDIEFEIFKFHLRHPDILEGLDPIPKRPLGRTAKRTIAHLMVQRYSCNEAQQIMVKVLNNIDRNDLVERFPHIYEDSTMETPKGRMLEILEDLRKEEFEKFQWQLEQPGNLEGLQPIPKCLLENAGRTQTVDLIVQTYTSNADQILNNVLEKIGRNDLVTALLLDQRLENSDLVDSFPNTPKAVLVKTRTGAHPITHYQDMLQTKVREPFACLPIGAVPREDKKDFKECYSRLTVTHMDETKISSEPVTQMERKNAGQNVQLSQIYKHPSRPNEPIRTVMSTGDAGVGKTFLVHKFLSDWANKKDQDHHLIFVLPFRQLNLLKGREISLAQLIHKCIDATKCIPEEALDYIFTKMQLSGNPNYDQSPFKVLFVLEGFDECHLKLDFESNHDCSDDLTKAVPLEVLLVNLIKGNLLRSAHLWITTRPAAAKQIPDGLVDLMTEVRGFTDDAMVKYIQKRCRDEKQADSAERIISHIKSLKNLYIMCATPVYCSIIVTVLQHMLQTDEKGELPKTLAGIYSHFLFVQTKRRWLITLVGNGGKQQKLAEADKAVLLKLGRLAFEHLQEGNIIFYQEDLERCQVDFIDGPGLCTEIFKPDSKFFQETVYCFVHLSIQEFLAAVYLFDCFTKTDMEVLKAFLNNDDFNCKSSLSDFLKAAMKKALQSENGHLDLFVRFLHGLSLQSNQRLLGGLLVQTENSVSQLREIKRAISNLNEMDPCSGSPDRCINIFQCLMEMKALSVSKGIQQYLESGKKLSDTQYSALVRMLQMSEEVLGVLDLQKCNTSKWGRQRLIPAVRNCKIARLVGCGLKKEHIEVVASALSSNPSHLRELDLSGNVLNDSGLDLICAALKSPHCCLEILRLKNCRLSERCCEVLASALTSNPSLHLRELDVSLNMVNESGMKMLLSAGLKNLRRTR